MKAKRLILTVLLICLGICFIRISVSAAGADQKPEAPTVKVSNAAASGKITLSWDPVDGASSYKIYRATSVDGTYTRIYTTESTGFTNGTAVAGSTYCYYVVAVSSTGESSDPSKIVRRTCDLPRPEITLQNVESTGRIRISWGAVSGAVSYKVYTSPDSKSWTLLKNTTGTALTHGNCEAGKTYYYKVMAVAKSSAANSAYSKVKSRTCDLPACRRSDRSGHPCTWRWYA